MARKEVKEDEAIRREKGANRPRLSQSSVQGRRHPSEARYAATDWKRCGQNRYQTRRSPRFRRRTGQRDGGRSFSANVYRSLQSRVHQGNVENQSESQDS